MALAKLRNTKIEVDLSLSPSQKNIFLWAVVVAACGSLSTLVVQDEWIKIIRFSLVGSGAIAGVSLLAGYKTPEKLLQKFDVLEQQQAVLEGKEGELSEQQLAIAQAHEKRLEELDRRETELNQQQLALAQAHEKRLEQLESERAVLYVEAQAEIKAVREDSEQKDAAREEYYQKLQAQLQEWAVNQTNQFNQVLEDTEKRYEARIGELEEKLFLANAPIPPKDLGWIVARNCWDIQQYLWTKHKLVLDANREQPSDMADSQCYLLYPRDATVFTYIKHHTMDLECELEGLFDCNGLIEITRIGGAVRIMLKKGAKTRNSEVAEVQRQQRARQQEEQKRLQQMEDNLYTIKDTLSLGLGFFIGGNSGSGKTATAAAIAAELAQNQPIEGIVLDIHNNQIWSKIGLTVICDPKLILEQASIIREEYRLRKGGKPGNRLIIFFDEFEETLLEIEALFDKPSEANKVKKFIADTARMLGSGGRKFDMCPIIMNQSWNSSAIKMDTNHRNNFVGIALNSAADAFTRYHCQGNEFSELREYIFEIRKDKYRALTFGAITPRALKHPTHHNYDFLSNGQPPLNLESINWQPLSIPMASGSSDFLKKYSEDIELENLPEYLQILFNWASDKEWISARDVVRGARYFRRKSADYVESCFEELVELGLAEKLENGTEIRLL